jgi:hypothetical protein
MKTKRFFLFGLPAVLLALGLVLAGCPTDSDDDGGGGDNGILTFDRLPVDGDEYLTELNLDGGYTIIVAPNDASWTRPSFSGAPPAEEAIVACANQDHVIEATATVRLHPASWTGYSFEYKTDNWGGTETYSVGIRSLYMGSKCYVKTGVAFENGCASVTITDFTLVEPAVAEE